jgi:hypothetical protein
LVYEKAEALDQAERLNRKTDLDRMAAILNRQGGGGYQVREEGTVCDGNPDDPDPDPDLDETNLQQGGHR